MEEVDIEEEEVDNDVSDEGGDGASDEGEDGASDEDGQDGFDEEVDAHENEALTWAVFCALTGQRAPTAFEFCKTANDPGILEELQCGICYEVVVDTYMYGCCAFLLCGECERKTHRCPICKGEGRVRPINSISLSFYPPLITRGDTIFVSGENCVEWGVSHSHLWGAMWGGGGGVMQIMGWGSNLYTSCGTCSGCWGVALWA